MKLLFDENLSPKLPKRLASLFPGSSHVVAHGFTAIRDQDIWDFAAANHFVIVTKDDDFVDLTLLLGQPPNVIKMTMGNCTNRQVFDAIRTHEIVIKSFGASPVKCILFIV